MNPLVPLILNTLLWGTGVLLARMVLSETVLRRPGHEVDLWEKGFFVVFGMFGVIYLALDNPSEIVELWVFVLGIASGVLAAFGLKQAGLDAPSPKE